MQGARVTVRQRGHVKQLLQHGCNPGSWKLTLFVQQNQGNYTHVELQSCV